MDYLCVTLILKYYLTFKVLWALNVNCNSQRDEDFEAFQILPLKIDLSLLVDCIVTMSYYSLSNTC